jgi:hypothetical protein
MSDCLSAKLKHVARLKRQRILTVLWINQMDALAILKGSHSGRAGQLGLIGPHAFAPKSIKVRRTSAWQ